MFLGTVCDASKFFNFFPPPEMHWNEIMVSWFIKFHGKNFMIKISQFIRLHLYHCEIRLSNTWWYPWGLVLLYYKCQELTVESIPEFTIHCGIYFSGIYPVMISKHSREVTGIVVHDLCSKYREYFEKFLFTDQRYSDVSACKFIIWETAHIVWSSIYHSTFEIVAYSFPFSPKGE